MNPSSHGAVSRQRQTFADMLLATAGPNASNFGPAHLGLSAKDLRQYSVARGLLGAFNNEVDGFEAECSAEIAKRVGRFPHAHGFFVPADIQLRDLTVATAGAGGYLVHTENVSFVDLIRNRSVLFRLGAQQIDGLSSNAAIPKTTAGATAYWLTNEATQITESQPTLGQAALTARNVGGYTEISRQLKIQSRGVESFVMAELAKTIAVAIDAAGLNGSGSSGQPLGIIGTSGIGAFTGTSLGLAALQNAQTDVLAGLEVDPLTCGYVTTPAVAALLGARQRFTGTDSPLWEGNLGDGMVCGSRALATSNMPTATMLYGDFSNVVVANYGVLELTVNPFANFQAGILGIRAMLTCDIAIRNAASFTVATSIT